MNPQLARIRRLSWLLLASLSLNAIQATFLFYWLFRERPPTPLYEGRLTQAEQKPLATDAELTAAILALKGLSIDELILKLSDKRVVENGFRVQDLSLAILAGFYYFDIERALGRPLQPTVLSYGKKGETLVAYPGLQEIELARAEKFIRQEKWPFRAQGLFRLLKIEKFKDNTSLEEAFFLTGEFQSVERLLSRSAIKPSKKEMLELILSTPFGHLAAFHEKQRSDLDLSEGNRRLFLIGKIHQGSLPAALLLLKVDRDFSLKKLDDATTLHILSLLKERPPLGKSYAEELLKTPRSTLVRNAALTYLPEKLDLKKASLNLLPQKAPPASYKPGK